MTMNWLDKLPDDWWTPYQSSSLSSSCLEELTIELLFIVRCLIYDARSYARACKRVRLCGNDFRSALDSRNIHQSEDPRDERIQKENSIVPLASLIEGADQSLSKVDRLELTMHWLAIDGEQPIILANALPNFAEVTSYADKSDQIRAMVTQLTDQSPVVQQLCRLATPAQSNQTELQEYVHPLTKNNLTVKPVQPPSIPVRRTNIHNHVPLAPAPPLSLAHELSREQQWYFDLLTKACLNSTDEQQSISLQCLSSDAALQPLLPRLLLFIAKGIEINVHSHDLPILLQLLSMSTMLTRNSFLSFDKYLHSIVPSLLTCLTCIFDPPKLDHSFSSVDYSTVWSLRDQASDLICYFQHKFINIPRLTERIASVVQSALEDNDTKTTFSIAHACVRTLLSIDTHKYHQVAIDISRKSNQTSTFESDFDLDYIAQQTLFEQKMKELLQGITHVYKT